ncbi:glycerol-3-phosphate 1-O-acyltransferase PlsB [uncultured Neptuniibacter sp.]|uniref:glycerol-3-phosphate 1-O-acyltransferase PlsB n=1 Tax=uncultured Neptuniibacter sp. TaxID=502143 RepID=UPI00262F0B5B|nr:glycerol-3-phosphate 1-O-acyltransferase PlsB [uncultured Neptuniibacter sp.]
MISLFERSLNNCGQLFIKLVTRPQILNPQYLFPENDQNSKVYYILESNRRSHKLLLRGLLKDQHRTLSEEQLLFANSQGESPLREDLSELIDAQKSNKRLNIQIVPVAIFHGRLPHREKSWLNILYAETWHRAGPIGSALQLLVNGRQTLIQIDKPLQLAPLLSEEMPTEAISRKAALVLRKHFNILRQSIIGPDLSHRRTLITLVLNNPAVQQAIDEQAKSTGTSRHKIERHCTKTLDKIAANFSPTTARLIDPVLNWLWSRLYDQVRIHNLDAVKQITKSHQVIYLPCHRSHMDYLLLSWALYRQGLMIPHVAAGENLNIPVIGPILKRGGAIFMRRRFQGDPLYACLYKTYLEQMTHRGHSLEYFIEGGRSRTGRLLPAKTGLLSMSIESFREGSPKPIALIPIWIGYDRLVESKSYQQELSGTKKRAESTKSFLASLNIINQKFGSTLLSFGDPLLLEELTDPQRPLHEDVIQIAQNVMSGINKASGITQSSLLATCLLGGSQLQSMVELSDQSNRLLRLLQSTHPDAGLVPEGKPSDWIQEAGAMGQLSVRMNLVEVDQAQAQELCFYRNNIQHMLILPAMYLLLAHRLESKKTQTINRNLRLIYPFLKAELFLPYQESSLTENLRHIRESLVSHNLLESTGSQSWKTTNNRLVNTLIMTAEPILLRYYIVLRVLARHEEVGQNDLIAISQQLAEQIHREYGYSTPEYKDERVLDSFITQLETLGFIHSIDKRIHCSFDYTAMFKQAEKILRPHMITLIDQKLQRV